MRVTSWWTIMCLAVVVVSAEKAKPAAGSKKAGGEEESDDAKVEAVIEDVNAKQLERLLEEKDYVAVYWCKTYNN